MSNEVGNISVQLRGLLSPGGDPESYYGSITLTVRLYDDSTATLSMTGSTISNYPAPGIKTYPAFVVTSKSGNLGGVFSGKALSALLRFRKYSYLPPVGYGDWETFPFAIGTDEVASLELPSLWQATDYVVEGSTDTHQLQAESYSGSMSVEDLCECQSNEECPQGQKCIDCQCIDCEEEQATHFRFRVEFDRETAVPDLGGNVIKIEIPPRSIASMNSSTVIDTASYSNLTCLVRAIPCDASGNPKAYNGNASFKCNAQSNTNQGLIEYVSGSESGWKHTGMINSSADGITGYQFTRIEVYSIEESATVYEEGCGGYVAEEPEQIPITGEPPVIPPPEEPDEPEVLPPPSEPSPPDDWPEPWEPPYTPPINPIPPIEPTPPEEPSTGCECEIYLAQYIGSRLVWLVAAVLNVKDTLYNFILAAYDIINALIQFLSSVYSNFSLFLVEFLRLIYQTALHFVTVYQNEQFKNREKINEIVDELKKFNTKFAEFSDNYEPVQIENEYRTQSHRVIDNLDSTLNKL